MNPLLPGVQWVVVLQQSRGTRHATTHLQHDHAHTADSRYERAPRQRPRFNGAGDLGVGPGPTLPSQHKPQTPGHWSVRQPRLGEVE